MTFAAKLFLALASLVVAAAVIAGFVIIPSPAQQRIYDLDAKRVDGLDTLASAVNVFVVNDGKLPANLADLNHGISWSTDATHDPETGETYVYRPGKGLDYSVCATFGAAAQNGAMGYSRHPAGLFCEARTATRPKT